MRLRSAFAAFLLGLTTLDAQVTARHAQRVNRLVIRNALVIDGTGTPASGPWDIIVEGERITQLVPIADALVAAVGGTARQRPTGDAVIDAAGKYVHLEQEGTLQSTLPWTRVNHHQALHVAPPGKPARLTDALEALPFDWGARRHVDREHLSREARRTV